MLTRQGGLLALGGVVLLVLARLLGIGELYVFGACCLGLVALAVVYVAARRLELEVNRTVHPARVHAGRVSRVDLRIRNLQGVDTPVLRLHEPVTGTPGAELLVPPLSRRSGAVASYRLPTDRRGLLTVGPLEVLVGDPFGLARTRLRAAAPVEVTVYPRVEEVRPVPYTATSDPLSGARQPHALGRTGDDFYALRPYVVGDDLRRVHWPSSARHDEMLVRQQEQPWQGRTTVLVDVRRAAHDPATFEAAVSAAASIVVANGVRRDLLRLMTTGGTDSGFGLGHAHMQAMLEHLAVVDTDGTASLRRSAEALHKVGGGALVVVMGQAIAEEVGAVTRLRGRFGSVMIVQVEHGRGGSPGAVRGGAAGGAVPTVKLTPGAPLASVWDPVVARQTGGGRDPRAQPHADHVRHEGPAMTQVMSRPEAQPEPGPPRGRLRVRRPAGDRPPGRSATLFAAEVSLTLVTAAAVVGMHRLFVDGSYRPALLAQAVAAHVVVALLRRARVSLPLSAVATVLAGLLALTWGHYLDTTAAFVPTGRTLTAAGDDLSAAWRLFQDVQAPAPVDTGFLLAAGAAVWVMVFVADWAAFRASATFEALLPSATLFLFAAALGAPGGRVAGATVYAAAAMLFVLIRRTLEQEATAAWAATHRSRGRWSLLGTGLVLVGVAVAAGAVAGPNLPGADDEAVIAWRDFGDSTEPRVVVSPMVDIQARMLDQPEVELFTVEASQKKYWRLTSLDMFDGEIWKSSYGTNDADGELPQSVETDLPITEVAQTFEVSRLARVWLPAAYEPMAISSEDGKVDWDPDSSTLIVDKDETTSDGLTYQVTSDVPKWQEAELRTAPAQVSEEVRDRYLDLPDGFSPEVRQLAEQVAAGAATPYDQALALQDYLKVGDFTYDLNVPGGHSEDALSTFLFDTKRGYCEQFAGSMAAMARAVGLPSRVAVGFTPGILGDDGRYHVRGEHAHAWVEVYMQGFGWIPFDPTPGRAPPEGEQWMGYAEQQDQPGGDGETPTAPEQATATVPTTPPGQPPEATGDTRPRNDDGVAMTGAGDEGAGSPIGDALRTLALAALAVAAAYLVIVPLALVVQHVVRRRRATTPAARVRLAWTDTVERADAAVVALPPSLTVGEVAGRLSLELPQVAPAVSALAGLVERTAYAEVEPSPEEAEGAERARGEIVTAADRLLSTRRRILRHADGRELWRRRTPHQRRSARSGPLTASTN